MSAEEDDDDEEEIEEDEELEVVKEVEVEVDDDVEEDDVELVESELTDELLVVVAVEGVDEVVWLVDAVWDSLLEVFPGVELNTRIPPTAATMTTRTTTATTAVLTALRPLRGIEEVLLDTVPLLATFSFLPPWWRFI